MSVREWVSLGVQRLDDSWADFTYIGEYKAKWEPGVIDRAFDEFSDRIPEDAEPKRYVPCSEYRYFLPYAGGEKPGTADHYTYGLQDYERMEALNRGEWEIIGLQAKAIFISEQGVTQEIVSGAIFGVESDSGEQYLKELEQEQLQELRLEIEGLGLEWPEEMLA